MIQEIRIQGFKALLDVSLRLGQVNVFIGANGSGKSSILEAVGVLGAAADGRVDDAALSRRGVRLGLPALYKTSLQEHRYRRFITLEASSGEPPTIYRVGLDNPIKEPLPAWRYHSESLEVGEKRLMGRGPREVRIRPEEKIEEPLPDRGYVQQIISATLPAPAIRLLDDLRQYRIFAPLTPVLRGVAPDPVPVSPLGLAGGGLAEVIESLLDLERGQQLLQALRETVEWVKDLDVLPPSKSRVPSALPTTRRILIFTDRWMREGRNRLSAYDASEGILYVLFMLVLALCPDLPSFFAVDNVGYGMHPRLVRAMIKQFCNLLLELEPRRQVLMTTHDPLLLDGLPLLDDRVRLFAVERDTEGAATVRRVEINEELLDTKKREGLTLSDLWVEGWLGGVPNVWW